MRASSRPPAHAKTSENGTPPRRLPVPENFFDRVRIRGYIEHLRRSQRSGTANDFVREWRHRQLIVDSSIVQEDLARAGPVRERGPYTPEEVAMMRAMLHARLRAHPEYAAELRRMWKDGDVSDYCENGPDRPTVDKWVVHQDIYYLQFVRRFPLEKEYRKTPPSE